MTADSTIAIPRRVLLLTGTLPGAGGVGEIILRDLCRSLPPGQIQAYALVPQGAAWRCQVLPGGGPVCGAAL